MNREELNEILAQHKLWLDSRGWDGKCAYLESADLESADLESAEPCDSFKVLDKKKEKSIFDDLLILPF
jgi:hypothetical protein